MQPGPGGCATAPPSPEALAANDPYEQTNRQTLIFNGKIDRYVVVPTVAVYFILVPEGGRRGVHNFLGNLQPAHHFRERPAAGRIHPRQPVGGAFSDQYQPGIGRIFRSRQPRWAFPAMARISARPWRSGARRRAYLVLPFLGPSNPRDAAGLAIDAAMDPTNYHPFKQHCGGRRGANISPCLDLQGQTYQTIQGIQRSSVDYYATLRSLYRQLRDNEIRNGRPAATQDLPDF